MDQERPLGLWYRITGLAGLMAGALSMALGEWLPVQSARELFGHQIGIDRSAIGEPSSRTSALGIISLSVV